MSVFNCLPSFAPSLAGGMRIFRCLSSAVSLFMCLPALWWGPALHMSLIHVSPFICLEVGAQLFGCLSSVVFLHVYLPPFICLAVWLVVSGSPDVSLHLFPFVCFPVWLAESGSSGVCLYMSPSLAGGGVCLHLSPGLTGGVFGL